MSVIKYIKYEDFGAVGDGITDDMEAICAAHDYANTHNFGIKSQPNHEYYIGGKDLTAIIQTETDWTTSRFIIDDRAVEDNSKPCFLVSSKEKQIELKIDKLKKDQKQIDFSHEKPCYVMVTNANVKKFRRFGLNVDGGSDTTDCFIVDEKGNVRSPIDWDYEEITEAFACPIDDEILTIRGGIFTTIANQADPVYNYYSRGIDINRSNTVIDGVTHYVVGEGNQGAPYRGFLNAMKCANITYKNCFSTGHKIYETMGRAKLPVRMGSYDLHANNIVNFNLINCKMNHINDRTRWGVIASNFCKNIFVEGCTLSRLDAHMGVSGFYTIRNCTLGWMGINAVGRGLLTLENSVLYGDNLIVFRLDYGSTWEGKVKISDCKWIISDKGERKPDLLFAINKGMHDFGYQCFMPETVEIGNLYIDDSALAKDHELYLFSDPDGGDGENLPVFNERSYPYVLTKNLICKDIVTASGKEIKICENDKIFITLG